MFPAIRSAPLRSRLGGVADRLLSVVASACSVLLRALARLFSISLAAPVVAAVCRLCQELRQLPTPCAPDRCTFARPRALARLSPTKQPFGNRRDTPGQVGIV